MRLFQTKKEPSTCYAFRWVRWQEFWSAGFPFLYQMRQQLLLDRFHPSPLRF